jgi:hypothetical protein
MSRTHFLRLRRTQATTRLSLPTRAATSGGSRTTREPAPRIPTCPEAAVTSTRDSAHTLLEARTATPRVTAAGRKSNVIAMIIVTHSAMMVTRSEGAPSPSLVQTGLSASCDRGPVVRRWESHQIKGLPKRPAHNRERVVSRNE